jgi:hypothetical protein
MRCKCCNAILTAGESAWLPEQHRHEDMCKKCRSIVNMFEEIDKQSKRTGDCDGNKPNIS